MRYATVIFRPVERLHPSIPPLVEPSGLRPVAIHQTRLLADDNVVTVSQVHGDEGRLRSALAGADAVIEFSIAGGDGEYLVYSHSRPHHLARELFAIQDSHEMVVQFPLWFTRDGGLRGTIVGEEAVVTAAIESLPPEIDVELRAIGDYRPELDDLTSGLTDRQREVLRVAIDEGYYECPRETSQRELAVRLDVAPATVGQHLQRIEATVFSETLLP